MREILEAITAGRDLTRAEARQAFEQMMTGKVPEPVIGALLAALRTKGECVAEIAGAAEAMRSAAVPIRCNAECIDTCGTGGDGISTFNVSTTAAIIAAAAGATVAKHGNRSTTRASGSTDVVEQLGIDVDAGPETVERCLADARIGYLNAQRLHPAMKHAAPVRRALLVRTIFNLLGPLTNPAGVRRQIIGVPHPRYLELMAAVLAELGAVHAWVVHGHDGLCDLTCTGETTVVELRDGQTRRFTVTPEAVGLSRAPLATLRVDSPAASAATILHVLEDATGPARDHALLNAGAALVVAGRAETLEDGVQQAGRAVHSGAARQTLTRWRAVAPRGQQAGPA
ncbi:MAG TPA: anthranilate phosphoribosyltransferase [Phycisphaerae bacterium]|nr:anthranilate phosphoribosyltransferase [Phycisphaerae bacterium]HNU46285.1 anthranilate phosphoribosyltransferase [Phycisphaerae bacterium]